jgi:hypothetical protein
VKAVILSKDTNAISFHDGEPREVHVREEDGLTYVLVADGLAAEIEKRHPGVYPMINVPEDEPASDEVEQVVETQAPAEVAEVKAEEVAEEAAEAPVEVAAEVEAEQESAS